MPLRDNQFNVGGWGTQLPTYYNILSELLNLSAISHFLGISSSQDKGSQYQLQIQNCATLDKTILNVLRGSPNQQTYLCFTPNPKMFKALGKMAQNMDKKIEEKTHQLQAEQERKELEAYLLGHGHDRVHSQILLAPGQVLMSKNKNYFAVVENTGDLAIYVSSHFCKENKIWSTKTEGKGKAPYQLGVQNDGDVVLYDGTMTALWKLPLPGHVNRGTGPYTLFMDDDGNLIFFDGHCHQLWESATARGHH